MPFKKFFISLIVLLLFAHPALCYDHFRFARTLDCEKTNNKGVCTSWNSTTTLYQYSSYIYYCFPGDLYVMSENGPAQMKDLKIDDEILSLNLQTGKNQYASITAWLHHDPSSLLEYSQIQVQNSDWKFLGSKYHNIAFSNNNQTNFKFLKDLNPNDTLVSMTNKDDRFKVISVQKTVEKQGLYSPLTLTGTFYIYPDSFNLTQFKVGKQYPMILVHSLSQIKNPILNMKIAKRFVQMSKFLVGSYQPDQDEQYVNPLLSKLNILFGRDWENQGGEKIAHKGTYTSYSSTRNRRREERKRKTMAILAAKNILSDTII